MKSPFSHGTKRECYIDLGARGREREREGRRSGCFGRYIQCRCFCFLSLLPGSMHAWKREKKDTRHPHWCFLLWAFLVTLCCLLLLLSLWMNAG